MAGEQRAGEEELERVEDRHGARRARQPHPPAPAPSRRGRRRSATMRASGTRDGSTATTPSRAQQLAHRLLEMEALEPLGQQQDEERLVHRGRTL